MSAVIRKFALTLVLVSSAPSIAFATPTNGPLTRAQVRDELIQLQAAGYRPNKNKYPADIQAAEARVAAQHAGRPSASMGVGGTTNGTSNAGSHSSK